jgi:hyperosmotically inducible periplasmic protein
MKSPPDNDRCRSIVASVQDAYSTLQEEENSMMYRTILVTVLCVGCVSLNACQSMTGKTAGETMDDASISSRVQGKLTGDTLSNFSRIDVDTDRGVVTLSGVVNTTEDKARATELARQVSGVTGVNNNLQIQTTSMSNP